MSHLASFTQKSAIGEIRAPVRIPTDDLATAVAVCIGLNLQPGVSAAQIDGREAPRKGQRTNRTGGADGR